MPRAGLRAPLRPLALLALLLLAGCAAPEPEPTALRLLALDGRWTFDPARAEALLAEAGAPAPVGRLVLLEVAGTRALGDLVAMDEGAAQALGVALPDLGAALVGARFAEREGIDAPQPLTLRAWTFPTPYVASYFEMERTPACDKRPDAKLCFLPTETPGEARLRLRVDPGGRDAGFLPDLVELGPRGRPAYWNGSFASPAGERTSFSAFAGLDGTLRAAEFEGEMAEGDWTVRFTLEANGTLTAAGAAGIVRVREPGYLWFDDRLVDIPDAQAQARAVLANATERALPVRATLAEALPLGADAVIALERAAVLVGSGHVSALLVELTPTQERAIAAAAGPDALSAALRARPLPGAHAAAAPAGSALVLAAPPGLDVAALPPVEGARAPALALAGRASVGEPVEADGRALDGALLLLAHALGEPPFGVPEGGRWTRVDEALENLSTSRTLALGSPDLVATPTATLRIETGSGNATRSIVAIGGVTGGPAAALWTSAALVAGAGHPVAPRLVVPLEEGADAAAVRERALAAWADHGVVRDR